ncbi:MAG: PilX N-terminal domain-containing pilus assembly protein, partial [Smithellaceae bacterium]|nr:PilX N-terminal domain-containing pilus assembly protein [Smithellaceae bacterium]
LVVVLLLIAALLLLGSAAITTSTTDIRISGNYRDWTKSLYICEAGIERTRATLKANDLNSVLLGADGRQNTSDDGILSFGPEVAFGGGTYRVKVTNNNDGGGPFSDADGKVFVTCTGQINGGTRKIQALLLKTTPIPGGARAAVTANTDIATGGTLQVDGRDHDIDGNLLTSSLLGKLGISTKRSYNQGGNSGVGGTGFELDISASALGLKVNVEIGTHGFNASIVEQDASWDAPLSPDQALGLPEGTLLNVALSGAGGSRYVTDPLELDLPHTSLSGVTYVDLPSGSTWQAMDLGLSAGILIVHNSDGNAVLKNVNGGTFKGIVIADDVVHVHNTIIGSLISLTTNPSEGNVIGNGNGRILYSNAAINSALTSVTKVQMLSWHDVY